MWCFDGNEVYYTIKEAAQMTGICYDTMKNRFNRGLVKGALPRTAHCSEEPFHPNLVPWSYIKAEKERIATAKKIEEGIVGTISKIPDYRSLPHTTKIQKVRETLQADKQTIANMLGVSVMLMDILEEGGVTHPKLAEKIGKVYKMSNSEIEAMIPVNYRKHGKQYDPDRYKDPVDIYGMNSDYFGKWRFKDEGYEKIRSEIFKKGACEANH